MKLYSIDINIYATAYVKASSESEAADRVRSLTGHSIEVKGDIIDGRPFDMVFNDEIVGTTLSPMMTLGKQACPLIETAHDPSGGEFIFTSHWDEHPDYPVEDWQYEVANGDTRLGYHDHVRNQLEIHGEP